MEAPLSFEKAFERLEKILEIMNGGKTSLEESLKFFEEAEALMRICGERLSSAEQKIEQLIKGRNGELSTAAFARSGQRSGEDVPF